MPSDTQSAAEEAVGCVQFFPKDRQRIWISDATAALNLPNSEEITNLLITPNNSRLSSEDIPVVALALEKLLKTDRKLNELLATLIVFRECADEARWITFILRREAIKQEWQDIAMNAFASPAVIELATSNSKLAEWIGTIPQSPVFPRVFAVIPPLDLACLREIRKSVDRELKRHQRDLGRRKTMLIDEFPSIGENFKSNFGWETRLDLSRAMDEMAPELKAVLYMRFVEVQTLDTIKKKLKLGSVATVHRIIRSILAQIRTTLEMRGD